MGLGLYVYAQPSGQSKRTATSLEKLGDLFRDSITDPLLRRFASFTPKDGTLYVELHPAEENVELRWDGDRLRCSAKTSSCGPGYHAYLVETLDRLGVALGMEWVVNELNEEEEDESESEYESMDETGYWLHRSFERLQDEMGRMFRVLADIGTDNSRGESFQLSLTLGFPTVPVKTGFAMANLGFVPFDWLHRAAQSQDTPLDAAAAYFPWWNKELDAVFWKRYALGLCWTALSWNVPRTEEQRRNYERALAAFRRARELEFTVVLPEAEIAEIEMLLSEDAHYDATVAGDTSRIGYFRHRVRRSLPGGWSILVPGHWHCDWEDENTTFVCWSGRVTIWISSYTYQADIDRTALEMVGIPKTNDETMELIDDLACDPPGWARLSFVSRDDESYWVLSGDKGKANGRCHITISYESPDDYDAAVGIWRGLK